MIGVLVIGLGAAVGLGVFGALVMVAVVGGMVIRNKIREFSRGVFGTDSLVEGINRQSETLSITPKSVKSMTRLMEPLIIKDFPDFVWEQFARKAENMLQSALIAISTEKESKLVEASGDVELQVVNRIQKNRMEGVRETFKDIKIHQTEIANYEKVKGKCVITIQSAVEYFHYKTEGQKVVAGSRERKEQARYNMELVYVQDADQAGTESVMGACCPNCGAPIRNLGRPVCEYCGTAVTLINEKVWKLQSFKED